MEFFTIGVYNSCEQEFFDKLIVNKIDIFCDIRQRRGVRGSKYSFVNSLRLQKRLGDINIKYGYIPDLAPTSSIREMQKEEDIKNGQLKRERQELGETFIIEYNHRIMGSFDFNSFLESLKNFSAKRIALFCVEEHPEACHRSIVAQSLFNKYNYKINHL